MGRLWAFVLLGLFAGTASIAGVEVCDHPPDYSFLSLAFAKHEQSPIDGVAGQTDRLDQNVDLMFTSASKAFSFGIAHRYRIFDFDGVEPQTNGHLHTSFAPLHWRIAGQRQNVRISAALALSGSSNVVKRPRQYDADSLQLLVALVSRVRLSKRLSVGYGICGDHRFGEYTVYPTVRVQWQPHPDWQVLVGFPLSRLGYNVTENITSTLQIAPDGNEWDVMDRTLDHESRFVYKSIALEWSTSWQFRQRFAITASLSRQLHNRYEMTLQNGQRVSLTSAPETRVGAGIRWRF